MEEGLIALALGAFGLGAFHTLIGPDHYLPFVAMAQTKNWSKTRTLWIVSICGLGHVLSTVFLGAAFILVGYALDHFQYMEGKRGDIAAWLLFSAGLLYLIWGTAQLIRRKDHNHKHHSENNTKNKTMTFWILFTIFIFGPCESLAGLLYAASAISTSSLILISILFTVSTVGVMILMTLLLLKGIKVFKVQKLSKYQHIIAGATIALCGGSILFLGL